MTPLAAVILSDPARGRDDTSTDQRWNLGAMHLDTLRAASLVFIDPQPGDYARLTHSIGPSLAGIIRETCRAGPDYISPHHMEHRLGLESGSGQMMLFLALEAARRHFEAAENMTPRPEGVMQ